MYAIVLDKPQKEILMKTLSTDIGALNSKILSIELLGSKEKIEWTRTRQGLVIQLPEVFPSDYAHAFKIVLEGYKENAID